MSKRCFSSKEEQEWVKFLHHMQSLWSSDKVKFK